MLIQILIAAAAVATVLGTGSANASGLKTTPWRTCRLTAGHRSEDRPDQRMEVEAKFNAAYDSAS